MIIASVLLSLSRGMRKVKMSQHRPKLFSSELAGFQEKMRTRDPLFKVEDVSAAKAHTGPKPYDLH